MKERLCAFFILLVLQLLLPLSLQSAVEIKVGVYQNNPKLFINEHGKAAGFYIDLLESIAAIEGWQLQYVPGTWQQCLERLDNGRIDLLPDIDFSDDRAARFDFNQHTVLSNWAVVYTKPDAEVESFADLKGKKIAFMRGDITIEQFNLAIRPFGIDFSMVEADDYRGVFELIAQRQADAGLVNHLFGIRHEREYGIVRSSIICCPRELRFAVTKNRNAYLLQAIDLHLAAFRDDRRSVYYRARDRWIEKRSEQKLPQWLVTFLFGAAGLGVVFFLIAAFLKRQVRVRTAELVEANRGLLREVTERKRAENELAATKENYRLLLESTDQGIYGLDLDGNCTFINDAAAGMLGYRQDEVFGRNMHELIHYKRNDGSPYPLAECQIFKVFSANDGSRISGEMLWRKDGSAFLSEYSSLPVLQDGAMTGLVITFTDISERVRAEEAFHVSEERMRLATELANVAVWEYDFTANRMSRSKNHDQLYGLVWQEQWDMNTFLKATHTDDREVSHEIIQKSVAAGGPDQYTFDFRVVYPDQSIHWLMVIGQVIERDSEGQGIIVRGCLIDITERQRIETELRESDARIRNVFEQANDGIYIISAENRYLDANERGLALFGYTRDELLHMGVADVLDPAEVARLAVEPVQMMSGVLHLAEWNHVRKDGSVFPGEVSAQRLNDNSYIWLSSAT
jgi:PAS domain S-box-containing protein